MHMKKGMAVTLAACIALSPVATLAEKENGIDVQAPVTAIEDEIKVDEFIEFKGRIEEITDAIGEQNEGGIYILVKNDSDALSTYVDEKLIILSNASMDSVDKNELEVGMEVSVIYHKDTPMGLSYPPMLYPNKIIVMSAKEEEKELNEFILEAGMVKKVDNVNMIPLRLVGEALGYKVSWNQDTKSAELTRGAQWTSVTIGQDSYNFAKMLIKLGMAPVLIESKTYVPLSFIEEVIQANLELFENGDIKVLY